MLHRPQHSLVVGLFARNGEHLVLTVDERHKRQVAVPPQHADDVLDAVTVETAQVRDDDLVVAACLQLVDGVGRLLVVGVHRHEFVEARIWEQHVFRLVVDRSHCHERLRRRIDHKVDAHVRTQERAHALGVADEAARADRAHAAQVGPDARHDGRIEALLECRLQLVSARRVRAQARLQLRAHLGRELDVGVNRARTDILDEHGPVRHQVVHEVHQAGHERAHHERDLALGQRIAQLQVLHVHLLFGEDHLFRGGENVGQEAAELSDRSARYRAHRHVVLRLAHAHFHGVEAFATQSLTAMRGAVRLVGVGEVAVRGIEIVAVERLARYRNALRNAHAARAHRIVHDRIRGNEVFFVVVDHALNVGGIIVVSGKRHARLELFERRDFAEPVLFTVFGVRVVFQQAKEKVVVEGFRLFAVLLDDAERSALLLPSSPR